MAVFAITHILLFDELRIERAREFALFIPFFVITIRRYECAEVVRNHAIVRRGMFKSGNRQIKTRR
ncbi:Uncharacterised protein [Vibrio cholerae]|nr:Uncharacterised protein [Vibrio cholerae]CSI51859.1 Uncharacterised protein [Vibrio cholerae]